MTVPTRKAWSRRRRIPPIYQGPSRSPRRLSYRAVTIGLSVIIQSNYWIFRTLVIGAILIALAPVFTKAMADQISYTDLLARKQPVATKRIHYGAAPSQFGDLWLPTGSGLHRVVVLIHGGCWRADLPGLELMAYAAEDLRQHGMAVWSIEHRRLGEPGGGYPGTFEDIANAIDWLTQLTKTYSLDLGNVVAVGHSSGGHLALWAAARSRLPKTSPLYRENPLPINRVVSLAGIGDLSAYRIRGPGACGEPRTVDALIGTAIRGPWDTFSDTSPSTLLPIGVPQTIISGALDPIVPAAFGRAYAEKAASVGDQVQEITIANAGHFELIDPKSRAFEKVRSMIERFQQ
jgi:acetyl esterase/lipase